MPSKILFSSILLYFLDEYRGISRDSLHSARETQLLCGGRLDGDIILIGAYHLCQTSLHGWYVGIELWALGTNSGIDVAQYISLGSYQVDGLLKQYLGINVQRLSGSIRK